MKTVDDDDILLLLLLKIIHILRVNSILVNRMRMRMRTTSAMFLYEKWTYFSKTNWNISYLNVKIFLLLIWFKFDI